MNDIAVFKLKNQKIGVIMYTGERSNQQSKVIHKFDIHIVVFMYWAVLVVWQNIGEYTARSSMDIIIKIGLLVWLVLGYIFNVQGSKVNIGYYILIILFMLTQVATFFAEPGLSLGIIISYIFPTLFLFLSFVHGYEYRINIKQYETFLNCIIAVVVYAALYAVIFKTEQFLSVFSLSSAYGNELTSFFLSSHEYGMYLVGGIISCIVCLEFKKNERLSKKLIYWLCLVLFAPNLLLTFSRTSLLGLAGFVFVYVFFRGNSKIKRILIALAVVVLCTFFLSKDVREFFFKIVLKDNNLAGRDELYELAIQYFNNADVWEQLFGRGITETRDYFTISTTHGSVHNAYLQVLLYYGVIGLIFMLCFILCRFFAAIKLIKKDKFLGVLNLGLTLTGVLLMTTNTSIIFNSPIDSFFLTSFFMVIPKYTENAVINESFNEVESGINGQ